MELVSPSGTAQVVSGPLEYAQVDKDGTVYYGTWETGLFARSSSGEVRQILDPYLVAPPYRLKPDGKTLFAHLPQDFLTGEHDGALTIGIAAINVATGEIQPVYSGKYQYHLALAEHAQGLLVQRFSASHERNAAFGIVDRQGQFKALGAQFPQALTLPEVSPQGRYMTYQAPDQVVVVDMESGRFKSVAGSEQPHWQKESLVLVQKGNPRSFSMSELFGSK